MNGQQSEAPRRTTLEEAFDICTGARNKHYGEPIQNHTLTANLYDAYLKGRLEAGKPLIDAKGVCVLNILQKISRSVFGDFTRDTLVDIEGYAFNIEKVMDAEEEQQFLAAAEALTQLSDPVQRGSASTRRASPRRRIKPGRRV